MLANHASPTFCSDPQAACKAASLQPGRQQSDLDLGCCDQVGRLERRTRKCKVHGAIGCLSPRHRRAKPRPPHQTCCFLHVLAWQASRLPGGRISGGLLTLTTDPTNKPLGRPDLRASGDAHYFVEGNRLSSTAISRRHGEALRHYRFPGNLCQTATQGPQWRKIARRARRDSMS